MKRKEDIGNLLQEKLKSLHPTPSEDSWDTLENALDKKKKKKRKKFFFFWTVGGASLLLLYVWVFKIAKTNTTETENITLKTTESITKNVEESTPVSEIEEALKTIKNDSITNSEENKSDTLYPEKLSTSDSERKKIKEIQRKLKDNTFWTEDNDKKTTTYYYYNGVTKKTIEFSNPKIIDSILKSNPILNDSIEKEK
ncbi:MAG: hypothetical protein R2781_07475 [Flavobacteriaceae bacterium]